MSNVIQPLSSSDDIRAAQAEEQAQKQINNPQMPAAGSTPTNPPEPVVTPQVSTASMPITSAPSTVTENIVVTQAPIEQSGIGVAASSMQFKADSKPRLPIGVYLIAGTVLITTLSTFIFGSDTSAAYWVITFCDVILAVGLLLRSNLARKVLVIFAVIDFIMTVIIMMGFIGLQDRANVQFARAQAALTQAEQTTGRKAPASIQTKFDEAKKQHDQLGKTYHKVYIHGGIELTVALVQAVYLSLPGVKAAFRN